MPIVFASLDVERTNFGLMSHTLKKSPQWLIFEKQKRHLKNLKKNQKVTLNLSKKSFLFLQKY